MPGPHENQEVCLSNLEAETKWNMKIHKPAQALLGGRKPGSHENQDACPITLEDEGKCHMKFHKKTAQALLGVESQGPKKMKQPAP